MSLSDARIASIQTLPIASSAAAFSYTFELPTNASAQILWTQVLSTTDATGGTRRMFWRVRDDTGVTVCQVSYFATQGASTSLFHSFFQGTTIVPETVLGFVTSIPRDGIFVRDGYEFDMSYFPFISAGDVFSGFFQTRGLHNGEQIQ
jgi:hypothetical protein